MKVECHGSDQGLPAVRHQYSGLQLPSHSTAMDRTCPVQRQMRRSQPVERREASAGLGRVLAGTEAMRGRREARVETEQMNHVGNMETETNGASRESAFLWRVFFPVEPRRDEMQQG